MVQSFVQLAHQVVFHLIIVHFQAISCIKAKLKGKTADHLLHKTVDGADRKPAVIVQYFTVNFIGPFF
ncbi:hypothetical protein D3C87_1369000 [compost metagenome]